MEEEVWKDIDNYEGKYQISNLGHTRSLNYNNTGQIRLLKPKVNKLGFLEIKLSKNNKTKDFMLANLVAKKFLPTKKACNKVINIDGDKTNCAASNLKWVYESERMHIMYNRGHRKNKGKMNKISYHKEGYKNYSELAESYLVKPEKFMKRLNEGWNIEEALRIPIERKEKILHKKLYLYNGKLMSIKQISKKFNITERIIYQRLSRGWSIEETIEIPILRKEAKNEV